MGGRLIVGSASAEVPSTVVAGDAPPRAQQCGSGSDWGRGDLNTDESRFHGAQDVAACRTEACRAVRASGRGLVGRRARGVEIRPRPKPGEGWRGIVPAKPGRLAAAPARLALGDGESPAGRETWSSDDAGTVKAP